MLKIVRGAWRLLVGIKDALVLALMLIFFGGLFAALSSRPNAAAVRDGALVIDLAGTLTEQPAPPNLNFGGGQGPREYRLRDVVRLIDAARDDARVKAIVLDLDGFLGGYPAALNDVGAALARARAKKPVLAYATGYGDQAYRLAANASEIWMNPMGGALFEGPGGSRLYYKGLIDKLGVNVHVYRVGKFKSFVEPYVRAEASPEAREADKALLGAIAEDWHQTIARARPKAQVAELLAKPAELVSANGGDIAQLDMKLGVVDKLGDRAAFDERVAQIAGAAAKKSSRYGFAAIRYDDYLDAKPLPSSGDAIGVVTIAGDIVDGKADAGTAGGDTIARAVREGLARGKLKALVVRIDSPGGSALASETIRQAILQAKAQKLPVIVSMGSIAASGGYWVATAGDMIFAEPNTITGSIGIFGIVPTFEKSLAKLGITADGVRTSALSGQPDVYAGTSPEIDAILQAGIDHGYRQFIGRVAQARHKTPEQVDAIAQGRVWDGGTARQIGLVDKFGGLDDAIAEAARRAKLDPKAVHAEYLEKGPDRLQAFLANVLRDNGDDEQQGGSDAFSRIAAERRALFARALGDVKRLATGAAIQARCLECEGLGPARARAEDTTLLSLFLARAGL